MDTMSFVWTWMNVKRWGIFSPLLGIFDVSIVLCV
jgi:hypothetical protein